VNEKQPFQYTKADLVLRIKSQRPGDNCVYPSDVVEAAFTDAGFLKKPERDTMISVLRGWLVDGSGTDYSIDFDQWSGGLIVRLQRNEQG